MRLLAYGGTSYLERCRIGNWPSIPEGALSDTYSLSGNELKFGVGLLDEESPFLILRQRQHIENRGGYAFTLLLDPGIQIWERFNWNGAALAHCITTNETDLSLLSAPEEATEQQLIEIFNTFTYEPNVRDLQWTRFHSLWVGAIHEQGAVVVSPKNIGLDQLPELDETAHLLSGLLPCFRCGFGWLMGGSREQGEAFGAHLVFDINAPDNPQVEVMIDEGEHTARAWEKVSTNPVVVTATRIGEQIAKRSAQPIYLWNLLEGDSVREYLIGITDLADRIDDPNALKKPSRYQGSELKGALAAASLSSALSGSDKLDEERTSIVLSHVFERQFIPEQKDVFRLHPEVVVNELSKRGLRPSKANIQMELAADVRIRVWRNLIETEEDPRNLPTLLKDSVSDLPEPSQAHELNQAEISALGELAIKQTFLKRGSLRVWTESLKDNSIKALIQEPLRNMSIGAVQAGVNTEVVLDYLAFGKDRGGSTLFELNLAGSDASKTVDAILSEYYHGKLRNEAYKWMMALADSPFRQLVPVDRKLILATEFEKQWLNLLILWHLCSGQSDASKQVREIGDFERQALHQELAALMKQNSTISAPPDLQGIVELLGELSSAEIEALYNSKRPRSLKSASRWLQGWKSLKQEEIYQAELIRLLLLEDQLPKNFSLSCLSDAELNILIEKTLTGDPSADATLLPRLKSLLYKTNEEARTAAAVKAQLEKVAFNSERPSVLIQFLQTHKHGRELLLGAIDPPAQEQLIMLLATEDEDDFGSRAYEIYREALVSLNPLSVFDLAVLRFLRSPKGKRIRNQISSRYLSILDADLDKKLRIILGNSDSVPISDQNVFDEAPAKGIWTSIKNWYHSFDE